MLLSSILNKQAFFVNTIHTFNYKCLVLCLTRFTAMSSSLSQFVLNEVSGGALDDLQKRKFDLGMYQTKYIKFMFRRQCFGINNNRASLNTAAINIQCILITYAQANLLKWCSKIYCDFMGSSFIM